MENIENEKINKEEKIKIPEKEERQRTIKK